MLLPQNYLNVYGKHRGKSKEPKLSDMVITTTKVLYRANCKIMSYDELDVPIKEKDKEFSDLIVRVLESCENWKSIQPTRTNLIGEGCDLTALGACVNGGLPAFGGSLYFISTHRISKQKESMIGASKSKVSKHTVPVNEAQTRPLGMDLIIKSVECLIVDPEM